MIGQAIKSVSTIIKSANFPFAKGSFEENEKGSLEKGKFADFIIVDTDLMACPIMDILKTKVLATYVNGEKVFGK